MTETQDQLAQQSDDMFVRNCGHAAKRGREVEVWIEGIPTPRVGFLAGLDDEFVQICLTRTQTLSNVRRDSIITLDETGRTIGALAQAEPGEVVDRIRQKIGHFQKRAAFVYGH